MVIQNQEDLSGNSLMITHTQFGIANSKKSHNFMTFISEGNNLKNIGAIEGTSGSSGAGMTDGVLSFSSPDRDYAEYMPKRDPSEQIQYGDVVGVFSGKVSKQTQGADLVMAISSTPIIVGNWPGTAHQNDHAIVGFLGQIPVKVKGPVKEGDLLIPSGHNDGWAIAIHPEKISSQWINSVIGQALESHTNPHVKKVNTLIGFDFKSPIIGRQIQTLKSRVKHLKKQNKQTKEKIEYYDRRRQNQLFLLQNKGRLR